MFIVTLPALAAYDPKSFADQAAAAGAGALEIRGDLTPDVQDFESPLPLLLALRGADEEMITRLQPAFVDLELHEQELQTPVWVSRIASFHDYKRTPPLAELKSIAKTLLSHKPAILKIATTALTYRDLLTLETLRRELAGTTDAKLAIMAMGPLARIQRLLSPLRNELTYTFLFDGEQGALGQVSLAEYKAFTHLKQPRLFGLLGGPACVTSLSPLIHNILFKAHGVDALYTVFPTDDLPAAFNALAEFGVEGFSVTAPWKRDAIDLADETQEIVKRLHSANTLVHGDGEWTAYNTDVAGVVVGYPFLKECASAAIIGSGGVAPAVIDGCMQAGIKNIAVYARNANARGELAKKFGVAEHPLADLAEASPDVIFCTLSDDIDVPLPKPSGKAHAVDLRYNKPTAFLIAAKTSGYQVHNGLSMLLFQALLQFRLFTGIAPNDDVVQSLLSSLSTHGKQ